MARERCQRCDGVYDVDARGRVMDHLRQHVWTYIGAESSGRVGTTRGEYVDCEGSRRPSKEQRARTDADAVLAKHREIAEARETILVALDVYVQNDRNEYADRIGHWRALALFQWREKWHATAAHPYRYATRVAPSNRRAETRGDIHCRFCGERLFAGVKQPHQLVKASPDAQRHLTICALQVLAGLRESVAPNHKALPMEPLFVPIDDGPLFGAKR